MGTGKQLSASAPPLAVRAPGSDRILPAGPCYTIGRDPASDIVVNSGRVSWQHAVLRLDGSSWVLEDTGSTNGTYLGPQQVQKITLAAETTVRLAHPDDGPELTCSTGEPPTSVIDTLTTLGTWTHPAVEVCQLDNERRGIQAATPMPAGQVIGVFGGTPVRYRRGPDGRITDPGAVRQAVHVAIDDDFVYALISPPGVPLSGACFISHSCHPNVRVKNQVALVTMRAVEAGEVLTTDYRDWDLVAYGERCWCNPSACVI